MGSYISPLAYHDSEYCTSNAKMCPWTVYVDCELTNHSPTLLISCGDPVTADQLSILTARGDRAFRSLIPPLIDNFCWEIYLGTDSISCFDSKHLYKVGALKLHKLPPIYQMIQWLKCVVTSDPTKNKVDAPSIGVPSEGGGAFPSDGPLPTVTSSPSTATRLGRGLSHAPIGKLGLYFHHMMAKFPTSTKGRVNSLIESILFLSESRVRINPFDIHFGISLCFSLMLTLVAAKFPG